MASAYSKSMERLLRSGWAVIAFTTAMSVGGCASLSNRTKTIIAMTTVGAGAGVVGYNTAPPGENPYAHGALWAGAAAAATGILGLYVFDEQKRSRELERQVEIANKEISALRGMPGSGEEVLVSSSQGFGGQDLPEELKTLLDPGWFKIYQTSKWVKQGDDTLIHQDKIVRIKKPQLIPRTEETK